MKKISLTLFVFVFTVALAGPAVAGTSTPPKNICLRADGTGVTFCIGTKKGARILYQGTRMDMYSIEGAFVLSVPVPADGSGYIAGDTFFFQISATNTTNIKIFGAWDVVTETGTCTVNVTSGSGFQSQSYDLVRYTTP